MACPIKAKRPVSVNYSETCRPQVFILRNHANESQRRNFAAFHGIFANSSSGFEPYLPTKYIAGCPALSGLLCVLRHS